MRPGIVGVSSAAVRGDGNSGQHCPTSSQGFGPVYLHGFYESLREQHRYLVRLWASGSTDYDGVVHLIWLPNVITIQATSYMISQGRVQCASHSS